MLFQTPISNLCFQPVIKGLKKKKKICGSWELITAKKNEIKNVFKILSKSLISILNIYVCMCYICVYTYVCVYIHV